MTDRPAPDACSAANDLRKIAAQVEDFYDSVVQPCMERNASFILFGEARKDPYAQVVAQITDLIPGFVTALRMRAGALSPPDEVGVATPPLMPT